MSLIVVSLNNIFLLIIESLKKQQSITELSKDIKSTDESYISKIPNFLNISLLIEINYFGLDQKGEHKYSYYT